jgi:hypothetical protein
VVHRAERGLRARLLDGRAERAQRRGLAAATTAAGLGRGRQLLQAGEVRAQRDAQPRPLARERPARDRHDLGERRVPEQPLEAARADEAGGAGQQRGEAGGWRRRGGVRHGA